MDSPFTHNERQYTILKLRKEKTPSVDGLSKFFMAQFQESLSLGPFTKISNDVWALKSMEPML